MIVVVLVAAGLIMLALSCTIVERDRGLAAVLAVAAVTCLCLALMAVALSPTW